MSNSRSMTSFNEPQPETPAPRNRFRRLDPAVTVRAYIANGWHDVRAVEIDDDTREVRVEWPPPSAGQALDRITHRVLTRDLYQAPAGALR